MVEATTGQGGNSAQLRQFNERVILMALRRLGQASKADLARFANLTDNTAGVIVRELQARRLIRILGRRIGARGQPATLLSLDPDGAFAIGIKIGRRSLDGTLVDFCGRLVEHRTIERDFPSAPEALALATDLVGALRAAIPASRQAGLTGVGVAMPYNQSAWIDQLGLPAAAVLSWEGFDLAGRLAEDTGLPVFAENDGTAAAIAELFQGHGRELDDFLYVFIGTAIGGGVVLNGEALRGARGNAGDVGLMPTGPSTLRTAPRPHRRHDVLLTRASINSLIRHLRGHGVDVAGRAELDRAIGRHDGLVGEWLDDCVDALSAPLLSAARLLDLGVVVLDGDLPAPILARLSADLSRRLENDAPEARDAPCLRKGSIGRIAAAVGAALLPLHLNFSPSRDVFLRPEAPPDRLATPA